MVFFNVTVAQNLQTIPREKLCARTLTIHIYIEKMRSCYFPIPYLMLQKFGICRPSTLSHQYSGIRMCVVPLPGLRCRLCLVNHYMQHRIHDREPLKIHACHHFPSPSIEWTNLHSSLGGHLSSTLRSSPWKACRMISMLRRLMKWA